MKRIFLIIIILVFPFYVFSYDGKNQPILLEIEESDLINYTKMVEFLNTKSDPSAFIDDKALSIWLEVKAVYNKRDKARGVKVGEIRFIKFITLKADAHNDALFYIRAPMGCHNQRVFIILMHQTKDAIVLYEMTETNVGGSEKTVKFDINEKLRINGDFFIVDHKFCSDKCCADPCGCEVWQFVYYMKNEKLKQMCSNRIYSLKNEACDWDSCYDAKIEYKYDIDNVEIVAHVKGQYYTMTPGCIGTFSADTVQERKDLRTDERTFRYKIGND